MSDDLEVTHGGAIAVDPHALRAVADALTALAPRFVDAASAVRRAHGSLVALPTASTSVDTVALWGSADRAEALHEECRMAGENTRLMADVYELVERRAELDALEIQGKAAPGVLSDRIDELVAADPRVLEMEKWLIAGWENGRYEGLDQQFDLVQLLGAPVGAPAGGGIFAAVAALGGAGLGRLAPNATLSGSAGPVSITPVRTSAPIGPPSSIAEALRRFPESPGAQLKVEKYTMSDGSSRFVLYSRGTQPSSVIDPTEPFDMQSNLDLYTGQEAASYAATVEALDAAGARPGDELQIYAHSQGAMNAAYLASGSEFDVTVQVTAGSPLHPTLDDDQLLIALRHTDDLVNGLAGGGLPGGTGSPDSIVATRVGDPAYSVHDLWLHPHMMESYIETAEMLDDSGDVRLEAWRAKAAELTDAVSIESTEYVAKRE
ncbi:MULTISPECIES: hypothetical protein [unclassified Microbacterium]|uniref:hypothetical protein n=1 Tax=unclassified Microbacterium TaxID=2609290 RepID=UPI001D8FE068|nr:MULTISPECIES: hypothetical protein [unclassified Microbacterium]CAH0143564.1 hypothetical protein SRABI121_01069 [Microbacterium sp. Bi121]HWK77810.1 hypothetical protein [Microbacterium sp.]